MDAEYTVFVAGLRAHIAATVDFPFFSLSLLLQLRFRLFQRHLFAVANIARRFAHLNTETVTYNCNTLSPYFEEICSVFIGSERDLAKTGIALHFPFETRRMTVGIWQTDAQQRCRQERHNDSGDRQQKIGILSTHRRSRRFLIVGLHSWGHNF